MTGLGSLSWLNCTVWDSWNLNGSAVKVLGWHKMLSAQVKPRSPGLRKRCFSCRTAGLLSPSSSRSCPTTFLLINDSFQINAIAANSAEKITFLKKRVSLRGSKMHKQYGKIKYTLLLLMEKSATGCICQIQSACQKVEESGRGSRE